MVCRGLIRLVSHWFLFCSFISLLGCLGGNQSSSQVADEILSLVEDDSNAGPSEGDGQSTTSNTPPIAVAGNDVTISLGSSVVLDGSDSIDPDADRIQYNWSIASMPSGSEVTVEDASEVTLTFAPDIEGQYVLMLTVDDGQDVSNPDMINVVASPSNSTPVANAGVEQHVKTGHRVTLNGAGSYDDDNDRLTFGWSMLARPNDSQAVLDDFSLVNPRFMADVDGIYQLQLVVSDGNVESLPVNVNVVAATDNSSPVASAGVQQSVEVNTQVTLNGNQSSDSDGDPLTYTWAFVFAPPGSQAQLNDANLVNPHFTPDQAGSYVISLTVNDGTVDSEIDTVVITATALNSAPAADAGDDSMVETGSIVLLDGRDSSDADDDSLTYQWSFVTLPNNSSAAFDDARSSTPSFVADMAGDYLIRLTVNDGQVDSEFDTVLITATSNAVPVANAGQDQQVDVDATVNLDASASSDSEGSTLTYQWTLLSAPASSQASLFGGNTVSPSFTPDVTGSYVFQLVVNDGVNTSDADTVMVTASDSSEPTSDTIVGYGANVTGGSGGEICTVTTLEDSSAAGTLRDCLTNRNLNGGEFVPRTVVFSVAGNIVLDSDLSINTPHLTVDGSTAASPGITINKGQVDKGVVSINTHRNHHGHNIIIKHLRFEGPWSRLDEVHGQHDGVFSLDGEDQPSGVHDIVLDHITFVSSGDAAGDMWGRVYNVTVQNCLFAHNLHPMTISHYTTGQDRYNITLYNNVFAHNHERSPQIRGLVYNLDMINNIVYDWGQFPGGYGARVRDRNGVYPTDINVINNVFTSDDKQNLGFVYGTSLGTDYPGVVYSAGNYFDVTNDGSTSLSPTAIDTPAYADVTPQPLSSLGTNIMSVGSHHKTSEESSILTAIRNQLESIVGVD